MAAQSAGTGAASVDTVLGQLEWRCIGPHRGGRVVAVAGDPVHEQVFYFGACAGGVWKTVDGGTYWDNVSDGYFTTAAVGAIAVADSDPNVIYVGTGETAIRGNVSHGDGVYKSTDGGKTWANVGLKDTRHIARVRIHPHNPDLVYVAALGHTWGPNKERGVYRSKDGGATWEQILFRSEKAGAIDLTLDPHNPRILYAATWEAQRYPHALVSGGEGSGIFKSADGGDTWTEITRNKGLPTGVLGKIGVAVSPAQSGRVWALVEAEDGALFRSDDGGDTWQRVCEEGDLRRRAWYYIHIFADPQDPDTMWVLNLQCWKSTDGGKTFTAVPTPHGDNHDLWIDPQNTQRMIEGHDGGACVSFNGGASWTTVYNQPTAQFYHVTTDTQFPYRVYGSQQDNSAITVPSRSFKGPITEQDWYVPGGGESGYIAVRPDNPNIVFGGAVGSGPGDGLLYRYDHRTGQVRNITVWPEVKGMGGGAKDVRYRFQWTFPIELSPHDPNVLYTCGNHVFRSTDEGHSWAAISPDLTRNDESKLQPSGGPITRDNTGAEHYCTIFAFVESPHEPGVLWAGTDDGLVHLSKDGGKTWQNVTPPASLLPEWALISIVEQSPHDPATAYVAATRYKHDDNRPFLLKTNDYGQTWRAITNGIPADDFTRTIREDPKQRGLLFAGTETAVYVSFDDGGHWQRLGGNVPVVPIHDLGIKDDELILATHGRSFWILDDLTPLRQIAARGAADAVTLFPPKPTHRVVGGRGFPAQSPAGLNFRRGGALVVTYRQRQKPTGETTTEYLDAGQNPPEGVQVFYYLAEQPHGEVKLTILDQGGNEIKSFSSQGNGQAPAGEPGAAAPEPKPTAAAKTPEQRVPAEAGLNRFVWNMRYPDPRQIQGENTSERNVVAGPLVPPGAYQVRLTVDGKDSTQPFTLLKDPRQATTPEDFAAQSKLLLGIRDRLNAITDAVTRLRDLREQADDWTRRTADRPNADEVKRAAEDLKAKLKGVEDELIQVEASSPLNFPARLREKLATLTAIVAGADFAPTRQAQEVYDGLAERVERQVQQLQQIIDTDVANFNGVLLRAEVSPVEPLPGGTP
ncbi:MAG TPA: glycosyl hydrolase [Thermomicrobiales bacterium]|nr:glycosyl hydrolase [Thermomicrobiales bacterium]